MPEQPPRRGRRAIDIDEPAALRANDAFYAAFNNRDAAAMDALWSRDAEVVCIHPGWNALHGREDVMASWEAIVGNPEQPRIVAGGARAVLHGNVAIVSCRELVGGSPLAATNIFVREGGRWLMVLHHSSPVAEQLA